MPESLSDFAKSLSSSDMLDFINSRETVTFTVTVTRHDTNRSYMVATIDLDKEDPELLTPIVTHGDNDIAGNADDIYDVIATHMVFRRLA